MGPKSNDRGLYKKRRYRQKRRGHHGGGSRNGTHRASSWAEPRVASSHQKPQGRCGTDIPSEALERNNAANTWILNFWPPRL